MNIKNSQIRARARHLLDDNVFGKDWLKAALTHFMIDGFTATLGYVLYIIAAAGYIFGLVMEYDYPVLAAIVLFLSSLIPVILFYAFIGPIQVGIAAVYMDLVRGERIRMRKFLSGFKNFFSNAVLGIMYILQIALWSCFFIIPGIYMTYTYALVFHVKRDHPDFRWKQCFDESERLMEGNRWKLFTLQVSHLGWFILGTLFLCCGSYWAEPYMYTSTAIFYEAVRLERN